MVIRVVKIFFVHFSVYFFHLFLPRPGNPGAARIRATFLGPLVTGQERPQHPLRSLLLPRAGQERGSALPAPPGIA